MEVYLADNAGETVFDRVLIETLAKPTTYVVKGGPVLNDALLEDALDAGLDRVADIIDNGSDAPGTILDLCSATMRAEFDAASLIVAKGQANYETLSDCPRDIFFLLQVKCHVIAQHVGVPVGSMVIMEQDKGDRPGGSAGLHTARVPTCRQVCAQQHRVGLRYTSRAAAISIAGAGLDDIPGTI